MLRSMVFQNFVDFEDRFYLDFSDQDKPFFFIGATSTGKTVVLELIRRCLSSRMNSSLTNRSDETKLAFAFCEFELQTEKNPNEYEGYGSKVITGLIIPDKENIFENLPQSGNKEIKTEENSKGVINNEKQEKEGDAKHDENTKQSNNAWNEKREGDLEFYKIIMYTKSNQVKVSIRAFYKRKEGGKSKLVDSEKNVTLPGVFPEIPKTEDIDEILEKITQKWKQKNTELQKQKLDNPDFRETDGEPPNLLKSISDTYVGILPNRGLGSLQWTRSELFAENFKETNYPAACQHAEIINDLIDNEREDSEVFKFLTSPNMFEFIKRDDDDIVVLQRQANREFPLLKTPIGILEAKQFSLVIEDDRFQTITFEEPENGMHPQMIERMKLMLCNKCVKKTVIIVTHCPDLIDFLSMKNTFIFYRIEDSSGIRNGLKQFKDEEINQVSKLCGMENLKHIFFSSKVLLVEGKSDKIILEAIFRYIFKNSTDSKIVKDFNVQNILSHHIIVIGGFRIANAVQGLCSKINVPCKTVLDRDVYVQKDDDNQVALKFVGKNEPFAEFSEFKKIDILEFLKDGGWFEKLSKKLKERNEFIWKDGDLEDFLLSNTSQNLYDLLNVKAMENIKRTDLKRRIKTQMKEPLSNKDFEELGEIMYTFEDTKRLLKVLDGS